MSFANIKGFIYCAECKIIHEIKKHSVQTKSKDFKIKPMTTEAIEKYTNSPRWPIQKRDYERKTKSDKIKPTSVLSGERGPIARIERNYQEIAKTFNLKQCEVKMNIIKMKWHKDKIHK